MLAHKGVTVPYQLHACPPTAITLEDERKDDGATLDDVRGTELGITDELLRGKLDIGVLEFTTVLHTAPASVGICALPALLVPWMPNSTLEFTAILAFQFNGVAL